MSSPSSPAVALDATLWDDPTTGIGLYTHELANGLQSLGVSVTRMGAASSGEHPRGRGGRTRFSLATLPALLSRTRTPLYHAVGNFNLPLTRPGNTRLVLTVHDLIPDLMPTSVSFAFRWQFRLWLRRSLQLADQVLCVSERTRRDLLHRFPDVEPARVSVVHNGVDHVMRVPPPDATGEAYLRSLALPERFLLFAGAWDARKNLGLVLDAWERMDAQVRPPLVLAGQSWFGAGPVEKRVAGLRAAGHDLRPLGFLASPLLYALMRRATVFLFPSHYEGFGLPPLEAMRLGTAAIISTAGSLPEVCGDAAVQVSPTDSAALASAITRLLTSESERNARRVAGEAWAKQFTWVRTAQQTLDAYGSALNGNPLP